MSKTKDNIQGIPDTFEVLHTTADNENTGAPAVTLRITYQGVDRKDFALSPDAARELASELEQGANNAEVV